MRTSEIARRDQQMVPSQVQYEKVKKQPNTWEAIIQYLFWVRKTALPVRFQRNSYRRFYSKLSCRIGEEDNLCVARSEEE